MLSRDETDPLTVPEWKPVEATFRRTGCILHLHLEGELIRTTPEHPFFVRGKGWTAAGALKEGDRLATLAGEWVAVGEVFDTGLYEPVYNLRLADHHTYFVGDEGWGFAVWAHNTYASENAVAAPYSNTESMTDRVAKLLRNRALYYRITQCVSASRNVAVILYRRDGKLYTRAYQSDGSNNAPQSHAEYIGLHDLVYNRGVNRSDILSLFTDRFPCSACMPVLAAFGLGPTDFELEAHWGIRQFTREAECQKRITDAVNAIQAHGGVSSLVLRDPAVGNWINDNT